MCVQMELYKIIDYVCRVTAACIHG